MKLQKIDELLLTEHYALSASDDCYFMREYASGKGYEYSETNQLIQNLKKPPERKDKSEYR